MRQERQDEVFGVAVTTATLALASVAQLVKCHPINQAQDAGSVPCWGTWGEYKRQLINVSLPLSFSLSLSLKSVKHVLR